jgi:prevent-host-death family protein
LIDIPVYEAKTRLSELLARVQQGEEVTITRHGRPMARLVAAESSGPLVADDCNRSAAVEQVFEELARLRAGVRLDIPLREAIESGRD